SGDVEAVRRLGAADGFAVDVVDAVREDGQPISSTLIRAAVAHGELDLARRCLGRPYSVTGTVERGAGRGKTIGVPTANLAPPDPRKMLPPDGVYAVSGERPGKGAGVTATRNGGVLKQGARPTFGVAARGVGVPRVDVGGEV